MTDQAPPQLTEAERREKKRRREAIKLKKYNRRQLKKAKAEHRAFMIAKHGPGYKEKFKTVAIITQ